MVASAGDIDFDGTDDVLISAQASDVGGYNVGAVFLFLGTQLAEFSTLQVGEAEATINGRAGADFAGGSVAGGADLDGDGVDDVAVGVLGDDAGGEIAGKVSIVSGQVLLADAVVSLDDALTHLQGGAGDQVGEVASALGFGGDIDGDAQADTVVGVSRHDGGGADAGAVFVTRGIDVDDGGSWALGDVSSQFTGAAESGRLGAAVATTDIDGDARDDVVVGAPSNGGSGLEGLVYLILSPL